MTRPPTEAALPGARRLGLGPSATNEKILKNEPAFAAVKRRATPATFNLVVWWRSRLGANKHVLCGAVRAVEARCFGHGEASLGPHALLRLLKPEDRLALGERARERENVVVHRPATGGQRA